MVPPVARPTLGLRDNWQQFALLVPINAFVGGMVGLERTIVPLIGSEEFEIASKTIAVSFIATFGVVKALANLVSGHFADATAASTSLCRLARRLAGAAHDHLGAELVWIVAANVLLGINQGLAWSMTVIMKVDLVGPAIARPRRRLQRVRRLPLRRRHCLPDRIYRRTLRPAAAALLSRHRLCRAWAPSFDLLVRDTRDHVGLEISRYVSGERLISFWEVFRRASFRDRNLFAASQAGLVNNLNFGMSWGIFPLFFSGLRVLPSSGSAFSIPLYPAVWACCRR